jgi:putative addiction module CopG family antidote
MEIELTAEQEAFVTEAVMNGRFSNTTEALRSAVDLWVERERVRMELLASLEDAIDSVEAGEYTEYDEESLANLPAVVAERNRARQGIPQCTSA